VPGIKVGVRWMLSGLLAVTVAVVGCGGDDDDAPEAKGLSGDPIPLAAYIKQADKICKAGRIRAREELSQLQARLQDDGELTPEDVMQLNEEGATQVRPLVRELTQLPPPDTKRSEADAYTRAMQETLFALDDAVKAFHDGDEGKTNDALGRNREVAQDIVSNAKAVGFKECGTEFSQ
jgi:hypothetical protein